MANLTQKVKPTVSPKSARYEKWVAAGRPKMDEWTKSGAGIKGGVASSGALQKRLKAEKSPHGRQNLLDRYDKWLDAGRPKMEEWKKNPASKSKRTTTKTKSLAELAKQRLTGVS